ncbi:MAG: type II secretion system protein GspC [Pseudobdellovibrio sp.]
MKLGKLSLDRQKKIAQFALYGLLLFIGFAIADLSVIYVRDLMIPNQAPPKKMSTLSQQNYIDRSQFSAITNRNLFASNGIMPDAITAKKESSSTTEAAPIPSTLPLTLIGTLVHSNPSKSIAAIEVKSKSLTGSYVTGADIEGFAKVEKVERGIVYIRNSNTQALEYIEMKNANKVSFDASKAAAAVTAVGKEVQSLGNNTFQIKRSDLLKYTNDLSSVLMQARAVPNRDPNTGEINGFRLLDMQEGSIFSQLGLARMDVLKSVNGEPIDSIQKAMELYNTLKNGNQVKLGVERGGKDQTNIYDIK